jgi:hypothetical protein
LAILDCRFVVDWRFWIGDLLGIELRDWFQSTSPINDQESGIANSIDQSKIRESTML